MINYLVGKVIELKGPLSKLIRLSPIHQIRCVLCWGVYLMVQYAQRGKGRASLHFIGSLYTIRLNTFSKVLLVAQSNHFLRVIRSELHMVNHIGT